MRYLAINWFKEAHKAAQEMLHSNVPKRLAVASCPKRRMSLDGWGWGWEGQNQLSLFPFCCFQCDQLHSIWCHDVEVCPSSQLDTLLKHLCRFFSVGKEVGRCLLLSSTSRGTDRHFERKKFMWQQKGLRSFWVLFGGSTFCPLCLHAKQSTWIG